MTSSVDPRAKDGFLQALELTEPGREEFLRSLEGESPELARQVRALIEAHADVAAEALEGMPRRIGATLGMGSAPAERRMGDYELLEEVGSGAFGSVWRARQVPLDRIVALKVSRAGRLAGARDLERLRAEAEAIARLDHPHIVPVHEIGEHGGHPFFSMKWIEGGTLAQRLDRPWPVRDAARLVVDVARAVHHAHQRGLLHRDLKPSNVLLDAGGRPHVADFGIAKRLEGGAQATTTHSLAGTPAYMAPEQAEGGELTVATDVWALGCILHELLAGSPPFQGGSVTEVLRRIRLEPPAPLRALRPDVPRDLETIVLVALRKEPARRYPSADALAEDLERWLAHEPIAARRTRSWERLVLACRRSPLAASLIGVAAGLVLVLAVVATWSSIELGARLRDSYLGQARATRLSGVAGARTAALGLLTRAAEIRPGADLRDEAIACLALTDVVLERSIARPAGLDEHLVPVPDPAFERLAVADARGLRILDFDDGSERAVLTAASDVAFLDWSPRGRWLVSRHQAPGTAEKDGRFRLWDMEAGAQRLESSEAISFRSADFAPDEGRLAYATVAGELVVLGLPDLDERLRARFGARTSALCFSPDGARLGVLVSGEEKRLELRDAETGLVLWQASLPGVPFDLCWTGDGQSVAVACGDLRVHLFEEGAGAPRVACEGHSAEVVEVLACAGSPFLSSYSWDESTRLWDVTTGREIRRMSARALGFVPGGTSLALTDERSWSVWRIEHDDFLRELHVHEGKSPQDLAFAPGGRGLATAGPDGVYVTDLRPGSQPEVVLAQGMRAVRFLPDGALATSGATGLWRIELEPRREPERLLEAPLWSLAVSADGRVLAVVGEHAVHLLDPAAPGEVRTLGGGAEHMEYVAISADGSRVAAGNWRGRGARLWDLREGPEPRVFLPEQVNVSVALSPDGERLVTVSSERLELWHASSGELLLAVERRRAFGNAPAPVAFSPDGTLLAFGLANEIVHLIDTRTLDPRGTLEPPELAPLFELAFSPDGTLLAGACGTNRVQLWDLAALERELDALGLSAR